MEIPTLLILGGTGRLATLLRRVWGDAPPLPVLWQTRRRPPGPDWWQCDPLSDPEGLAAACTDAAVILDLSGQTTGDAAALSVNEALARSTLAAASDRPVILASSAAVYGAAANPGDESAAPTPISAYGMAKAAVERAATSHPRTACLRIANIAGADALLGDGNRRKIVLDRFADGTTPVRSYLGPVSFAAILGVLLRQAVTTPLPRVLNVAAPETLAMGDLLDAAGLPWTPRAAPETALPAACLAANRLATLYRFQGNEGSATTVAAEWQRAGRAP